MPAAAHDASALTRAGSIVAGPAGHARPRVTGSGRPGRCGYRGPAAYSKTGELTLRYIGSPDTVEVPLRGAHPPRQPRVAPSGALTGLAPAPLKQPSEVHPINPAPLLPYRGNTRSPGSTTTQAGTRKTVPAGQPQPR